MIGHRLAQFEISDMLGEGGMGQVYRARDAKLGREVAIKVLPEVVAADPERLARFEREARVLASLNHPNIAAIHAFESAEPIRASESTEPSGRSDGAVSTPAGQGSAGRSTPSDEGSGVCLGSSGPVHFIVMELVEGETLQERIAAGAIPVKEALGIAQQVAVALEAAHARGIVHRDLKPANVKLAPDGKVKVLDFGLAKALEPEVASGGNPLISASPTLTQQMTQAGVLLGTAAYMSPEQARGKTVDKRSDIWAFGCLLLEMLTGKRTFAGETLTDVIAAVVAREPDWEALPPNLPRSLQRLLRRCLEKDADQRLHDIADARLEIADSLEAIASGRPQEAPSAETARPGRERLLAATTVLALALAAVLGWLLWSRPEPERPVIRTQLLPPPETSFHTAGNGPGAAVVSPDGRRLAFSADDRAGEFMLWVRELDELEARPITTAASARFPFWSPDSRFVAFFDEDKLKKVEATGGPALPLCDAANGKGGSWNADGVILFAPSHNSGIFRVSAAGGEPVAVTELDLEAGENSHRHPRFLPDGEHFLYLARMSPRPDGTTPPHRVYLASLDGERRELLLESPHHAEIASGHLWFAVEGTMMAQPFDLRALRTTGDAFPVAEGVLADGGAAFAYFSISEAGVLAYHTGAAQGGTSTLVWRDRQGEQVGTLGDEQLYWELELSPDGGSVAVVVEDAASGLADIWIHDVERDLRTRFTFGTEDDSGPSWAPDGRRLAYSSSRAGVKAVYVKEVGGAAEEELLYAHEGEDAYPESWAPDGRRMVVSVTKGTGDFDLWLLPLDGEGAASPLIATEFWEGFATISPDGRWLAYQSEDSGKPQVYVTTFPEVGRRWLVSTGEGRHPSWSDDGRELFFVAEDGVLEVARVEASGDSFRIEGVDSLFALNRRPILQPAHAVSGDGQRVLVNTRSELGGQTSPPVNLVINVEAELGDR